jgi:hypothetical protein
MKLDGNRPEYEAASVPRVSMSWRSVHAPRRQACLQVVPSSDKTDCVGPTCWPIAPVIANAVLACAS